MVFLAFFFFSAPGGECDNMIVVLKLVTNLMKRNNFWGGGQGLGREQHGKVGKKKVLASFISVDNELERCKEVHEMVFPKFDKEHTEACVMTLRPEENQHR